MKTAARILIIISMICTFYTILPLIFGSIALKKIKNDEVTVGTGVLTLLFVNWIAGILLLIGPKKKKA